MATDVGSPFQFTLNFDEDLPPYDNRSSRVSDPIDVRQSPPPLVTRDFLGISASNLDYQELDLDVRVPTGYEKLLDLKTGRVYVQRCKYLNALEMAKLQDLNIPPSQSKGLSLGQQASLELKLIPPSPALSNESVCTLDKVKHALERAEREAINKPSSIHPSKSRSQTSMSPVESSSSNNQAEELNEDKMSPYSSSRPSEGRNDVLFAAGCPRCLLYVLISVERPRCPGCHGILPSPTKNLQFDLNISM